VKGALRQALPLPPPPPPPLPLPPPMSGLIPIVSMFGL